MGQLAAFFALTFAVSWTIFSRVDPRGGLNPIFLIGVFAPGIIAITIAAFTHGTGAVRKLVAPILRTDVALRWYVFAAVYMLVIKLAAALAVRLSTGAWPGFGSNLALVPLAILVSTPVQAGEEVGWRGYALPRLTRCLGLRCASVALGIIWAFWHLPLFYVSGTDTSGQSFPVYLGQVTALSVAISWLYARSRGSLLPVMLMHSAINQAALVVPAGTAASAHPWTLHASMMSWATLALLWIGATYFLIDMPTEAE